MTAVTRWNELGHIPFAECVVSYEPDGVVIRWQFEVVARDGCSTPYLRQAMELLQNESWPSLCDLWTLRNILRENEQHGLHVDDALLHERMTETDFRRLVGIVRETDPSATV